MLFTLGLIAFLLIGGAIIGIDKLIKHFKK